MRGEMFQLSHEKDCLTARLVCGLALVLILLFPTSAICYKARLNDEGLARIAQYKSTIERVSVKNDIPKWWIYGIIYNETNARNLMGDRGGSFGLGQIRCSMSGGHFSWLPYLNDNGLKMHLCVELYLQPKLNIEAIGIILKYIKTGMMKEMDSPALIEKHTIRSYNLGSKWRVSKKSGYFDRVKYFGKQIEYSIYVRPKKKYKSYGYPTYVRREMLHF